MHLFFDLDGVLIDLKELHRDAYITAWYQIHPHSPIDTKFHADHLEALPTKDKIAICNRILHTEAAVHPVSTLKQLLTEQLLIDFTALSRPVTDTIRWLKSQGHVLACCSNSIRKTMNIALQKLEILDQFDLILSNEDVSKSKPSPEIYLKAAAQFSVDPVDCIVFEDSVVGKQAASAAGCCVIPIINSHDITIDFLKICLHNRSRIPSLTGKIHLVIPMGGLGSRFEKEGYTIPKPFLPIFGKPMYKWVIENMLPTDPVLRSKIQTHLIVREEHASLFASRDLDQIQLHTIPSLTEGPACTVLTIRESINTQEALVIANSDQHLEWDSDALYYSLLHPNIDGIISTFAQHDPSDIKWSYAKTDAMHAVMEVAEKRYISSNASTGIYGWSRGADFVRFAESMIQQNIRVNNEFYVCPVYNEAIRAQKTIRVHDCIKMWGLGIPKDYEYFISFWARANSKSETNEQG